jgi:hypothetical protein
MNTLEFKKTIISIITEEINKKNIEIEKFIDYKQYGNAETEINEKETLIWVLKKINKITWSNQN